MRKTDPERKNRTRTHGPASCRNRRQYWPKAFGGLVVISIFQNENAHELWQVLWSGIKQAD